MAYPCGAGFDHIDKLCRHGYGWGFRGKCHSCRNHKQFRSASFKRNNQRTQHGNNHICFKSRRLGDTEQVKRVIRHAVFGIFVFGIPICILNISLYRMIPIWLGAAPEILHDASMYNLFTAFGRIFMLSGLVLNGAFRGYGDPKTTLKVNMITNVVNVIFNFFLIYQTRVITVFGISFTVFGAGLGVSGAAIATAIGMVCGGVYAFGVIMNKKNKYCIKLRECFKVDKSLAKNILSVSFPSMMERVFMSSSGLFVTSSIALLGTTAVAANSLSLTAESLSYMPGYSFGIAINTLIGQSLGAGKPDLAVRYIKRTLVLSTIAMTLSGIGLFVFSEPIISVFTPDNEVIYIASNCLRILALIQPIQMAAWIFSGVLRGSGDTKSVFYINAATNWGIRTLGSVVAIKYLHFGIYSAQVFLCVEITARLICMYLRYRTDKWKHISLS